MEQPFGDKDPENIIQESTTEKNCSNLTTQKKIKMMLHMFNS